MIAHDQVFPNGRTDADKPAGCDSRTYNEIPRGVAASVARPEPYHIGPKRQQYERSKKPEVSYESTHEILTILDSEILTGFRRISVGRGLPSDFGASRDVKAIKNWFAVLLFHRCAAHTARVHFRLDTGSLVHSYFTTALYV